MTPRFFLSLALGLAMAATSSAFAPAPVFREPPKPKVPEIFAAIQGTWDYTLNARMAFPRGGLVRTMRVRIQDDTWTYIYIANGVEREGAKFRIVLDPKQSPPTLDLENTAAMNQPRLVNGRVAQFVMKGIVKVEGDTLMYCYVGGHDQNTTRPRQFEIDRLMPNGGSSMMMTLQRVK